MPVRGGDAAPCSARVIQVRPRFTMASCIDTSTTCPLPVVCRCHSAASMPMTACSPVPESPAVMPGFIGGPSASPVEQNAPPAACATGSKLL